MPVTWTVINNDNMPGHPSTLFYVSNGSWDISNEWGDSTPTSNSYFAGQGPADDWLISPPLNLLDTSVTITGTSLMANGTGGIYQWLDCNNNLTAIVGAQSQTFTPSMNGSYAVVVTD
jgi:hypothetical protein